MVYRKDMFATLWEFVRKSAHFVCISFQNPSIIQECCPKARRFIHPRATLHFTSGAGYVCQRSESAPRQGFAPRNSCQRPAGAAARTADSRPLPPQLLLQFHDRHAVPPPRDVPSRGGPLCFLSAWSGVNPPHAKVSLRETLVNAPPGRRRGRRTSARSRRSYCFSSTIVTPSSPSP